MCEILDNLKMIFERPRDIYLPAGQYWHMIYTLNFIYLKNWGKYEVLRMKLGEFIVNVIFIYGSFLALWCFCLQFWNFSLVLIYSYVCTHSPALLYPIPCFLVYCFPGIAILPSSPHSCKALLSFMLFSLTLLSLTLLVVPPCPKVVVITLTFTDTRNFFLYYLQFVFVLLPLENETVHLLIPLLFMSCGHGMQPTVLHEFHIHPISGMSNFILTVPNVGSMLLL